MLAQVAGTARDQIIVIIITKEASLSEIDGSEGSLRLFRRCTHLSFLLGFLLSLQFFFPIFDETFLVEDSLVFDELFL